MTAADEDRPSTGREGPAHRYTAQLAGQIELSWQRRWAEEGTFDAPNPKGALAAGFDRVRDRPKLFVMDMFPYPSGAGLHVGHPLGYIGTDVYSRFKAMSGFNVLHPMGFDSFGLPAEQYAVQTGQHPRITTDANIANMRRQMERLGLGFDWRRSVATTDVAYYRWTQWIFLQLFNAFYDTAIEKARPIEDLITDYATGSRALDDGRAWDSLSDIERHDVIDSQRLVYLDDALVNWCPALGTVLANEEVTPEGRSDRGNFPVHKVPLKQWKMRITAYAERLLADLDDLDWPEPTKVMQRNWIGRSTGARVRFGVEGADAIEVYTTRPDTLFGATYMVVAPEYEGVETLTTSSWPPGTDASWTNGHATPSDALAAYRAQVAGARDMDRLAADRTKTGVFTGTYAVNPVNGASVPVFVADYVLAGYGTGAIMAVPAHDQRDFDFARAFGLPIVCVVEPPTGNIDASAWAEAYDGPGRATNSASSQGLRLDGLATADAKERTVAWLEERGAGKGAVAFKLRDWLFSRQRYWGEPIPVVYDEAGNVFGVPEDQLPVELPDLTNYEPEVAEDPEDMTVPQPPLARAREWVDIEMDLGDGLKTYRRETNTMPQWAGSCWYYLRYLDPDNDGVLVDPDIERYWMGGGASAGGVDLYVGGVEHAVLHLLYSRFWHKALYDLGHVSTPEPFQRLFNQGYILAAAFTDERGMYVDASAVAEQEGVFEFEGKPVAREFGKMGKSLKNAVTPDEMCDAYGADTLRVYEMSMGPLDQSRPWETRAVVGAFRLLQRLWRLIVDEDSGAVRVSEDPLDDDSRRSMHRTIEAVRDGMDGMRFNVSIARITELITDLTQAYGSAAGTPRAGIPREGAEALVLMTAPFAPHIAEELWSRLGHAQSVSKVDFPEADPVWTKRDTLTVPVQVKGKLRGTITVPAATDDAEIERLARAVPKVAGYLADGPWRAIVIPGRLVNFVPAKS
ncbi:MAG: leucine--tRNA ligase [Acidimicrobiales bacterium]